MAVDGGAGAAAVRIHHHPACCAVGSVAMVVQTIRRRRRLAFATVVGQIPHHLLAAVQMVDGRLAVALILALLHRLHHRPCLPAAVQLVVALKGVWRLHHHLRPSLTSVRHTLRRTSRQTTCRVRLGLRL